jgi:hypothetical protein
MSADDCSEVSNETTVNDSFRAVFDGLATASDAKTVVMAGFPAAGFSKSETGTA